MDSYFVQVSLESEPKQLKAPLWFLAKREPSSMQANRQTGRQSNGQTDKQMDGWLVVEWLLELLQAEKPKRSLIRQQQLEAA